MEVKRVGHGALWLPVLFGRMPIEDATKFQVHAPLLSGQPRPHAQLIFSRGLLVAAVRSMVQQLVHFHRVAWMHSWPMETGTTRKSSQVLASPLLDSVGQSSLPWCPYRLWRALLCGPTKLGVPNWVT